MNDPIKAAMLPKEAKRIAGLLRDRAEQLRLEAKSLLALADQLDDASG